MRGLITVRFLCNNFVLENFFEIELENILPDFSQAVRKGFVARRSDREILFEVIFLLFHS